MGPEGSTSKSNVYNLFLEFTTRVTLPLQSHWTGSSSTENVEMEEWALNSEHTSDSVRIRVGRTLLLQVDRTPSPT